MKAKMDKLQADLEQANKDLAGVKEELAGAKVKADKLREAMNLKGDEISFLRGAVWHNSRRASISYP